eukprot:12606129-Heterocapsa_arctica.AAC.1
MGKEQWKWDEYDEIWGFDHVLEGTPSYVRDLNGLRNRQSGTPDQLEEGENIISMPEWKGGG